MRKFLLMSSALVVLSGVANAACIQTPSCSSLGYSSTTACEGGLKCPWGNAWFCNVGGGSSTPDYSKCKIGDILYSDFSCNANMIASKTPIGVVFDTTNGLAIAKDEFANLVWGAVAEDVSGIQNSSSTTTAVADWQGFNNTKAMYDYEKSQNSYFPSMEKVLLYSTTGTSQGQWYLPSAGELKAISDNKDALNTTLSKIGGTQMLGNYWSSSEQDSNNAWRISLGGNLSNEGKGYRGTAKPIINFASKDKISVDLNKSTACKIGNILYSDKTCSASVVSGKTPIGVVFDTTNHLAIALDMDSRYWSSSFYDIPGITNIIDVTKALQDFNGKENTAAIKAYNRDLSNHRAASYVYNYTTAGTKVGDWYLPALGELNEIYQNKTTIDKTLSALGKSAIPTSYHWSSSEYSNSSAWVLHFYNGSVYNNYVKNDYNYYVRPVLAF